MKKAKNIIKEAAILLIIAVMVLSTLTVTANTNEIKNIASNTGKIAPLNREILFQDDFESYADFLIDFPPWINIDVDGDPSVGSSINNWPNENLPQAFIIFVPLNTTPPWTDPLLTPHSGTKFAGCFNANNVGYISDDWLVTPLLGPANYDEVSFWAKSFNNQYNLERFEVGISTTDTNPSSFTIISTPPYVIPPYQQWNLYTYNLDNYDNQAIYIGIHMMSVDSWLFMVDDFQVNATIHVPEPAICCEGNLIWEKVKANSTVNSTFQVSNCGEPGTLLNWEVDTYPDWGTWTFTPSSGTGLAEGDSVTITAEVVAPPEKKKTFTGKIKMINLDNTSDFCEIDVSLKTPRARTMNGFNMLNWILEKYPKTFPIFRCIFG
jgi:hypothetical protein